MKKKLIILSVVMILLGTSATAQCFKKIVAGQDFFLAISQDGTLWAWGENGSGQLGDGTTTDRTTPVQISTAANWAFIAAGDNHWPRLKQTGRSGRGAMIAMGNWGMVQAVASRRRCRSAPIPTGKKWPQATEVHSLSKPLERSGLGGRITSIFLETDKAQAMSAKLLCKSGLQQTGIIFTAMPDMVLPLKTAARFGLGDIIITDSLALATQRIAMFLSR